MCTVTTGCVLYDIAIINLLKAVCLGCSRRNYSVETEQTMYVTRWNNGLLRGVQVAALWQRQDTADAVLCSSLICLMLLAPKLPLRMISPDKWIPASIHLNFWKYINKIVNLTLLFRSFKTKLIVDELKQRDIFFS